MTIRVHYVIKPENLINCVKGLESGKTLDYLYMFLSIIGNNCNLDPYYFIENEELTRVLFTETYPSLFQYLISHQKFDSLISTTSIYIKMCNSLSLLKKYTFLPFLTKFFSILKPIIASDVYIDAQFSLNYIKEKVTLNIFQRFLIDQLARQEIIKIMINSFLSYQSFSECADFFSLFNQIFPYVKKTVLQMFEAVFSQYSYSLDDFRFDDKESLQLTKAMSTCSTKYAQIHLDNIVKFLMSDENSTAKEEFINLIKNKDNLNCISQSILDLFDVIMASMREDDMLLTEISSILILNKICEKNFFIEKAEYDVYFNCAFFEIVKENYTKESVNEIIKSETFCEKTVEFGFKVIDFRVDLMSNLPLFLQRSFSSFWKDERMETIKSLSKQESYRNDLLNSIKNYRIENQNEFKIVCEFLSLLKPSKDEFDYAVFLNEALLYIDSIFVLPFLSTNSFIPSNLIDIEDLISFSIFNEKFSNFLFENFSEDLPNHIDLFLNLTIANESENKILGRFLFNLIKKTNCSNKLIWESVIRLQDEDEEVHLHAQKLINDDPESSQNEIITKLEEGYAKYFINFDFQSFPESSAEENGNYLFFRKPKVVSEDSFFYLPSKVCHALNNSEEIEISDVNELIEFQTGDAGIDTVILNIVFDASLKLNIEFKMIKKALNLAFQMKFKSFIDRLFQYIIDCQEEIIEIDEELLNSFSKFNEKYTIELIEKKKVSSEKVLLFFSKYQNYEASSILRKIDFEIPINLLDQVIYTKNDFIDFIHSNRINHEKILPYLFSPIFPQFYRTRKIMNSVFQFLYSNPNLLLQFLKSHKIKNKNNNLKHKKVGYMPHIQSTKYFNIYLVFALLVPDLNNFPNSTLGEFFSDLIFSRQGEEDNDLVVPIKEPIDETNKQKVDKDELSRYQLNQSLGAVFNELPNEVLKKFEFSYSTKNLISTSNFRIFHDFSMIINENSISDEFEKYYFLKHPQIFLFKVYAKKEFKLEQSLSIDSKKYSLSFIITKTSFYVIKQQKERIKYVKFVNGEKSISDSIEGKIVFAFYRLNDENQTEYENLKSLFKKFRTCRYSFNERAVICDSLNQAKIEWKKWNEDETLFEIATILLCDFGYTELFKQLSSNCQFSEYFFKSDWKEQFSLNDIDEELVNLATIYPRREDLLDILIKSIEDEKKRRFVSIILNSFDLNDEYIEKVISTISPQFDHFEDFIFNYFMKETTTNSLLLQDESLSSFVFNLIEERIPIENNLTSLESLPFAHLLKPMTDNLLIICMRTLSASSKRLILKTFGQSISFVLRALTCHHHTEELATMFVQIDPSKNDDELILELRKDVEWAEYCLSSSNESIRRHTYCLMKTVFTKEDTEALSFVLRGAILKSLFMPFLEELKNFVFATFGAESVDSPEFTSSIYDRLFDVPTIPSTYPVITMLFDSLSPPPSSSIIKWHNTIKKRGNDDDQTVFLIFGTDLIYASFQCHFEPSFVGFFEDILTPIVNNCSYQSLHKFIELISYHIEKFGVFNFIKLMVEFDVIVYEYVPYVQQLVTSNSDFRETELIVIAVNLPSVILKRRNLIKTAFNEITDSHKMMIQAFETANAALSIILKINSKSKDGFVRKSERNDISQLISDVYFDSFLPFFSCHFKTVINMLISASLNQVSGLKKFIKYVTFSSLAFRDVLEIVFGIIEKVPGLRLFGKKLLQLVEREWSEMCCEITREVLSDFTFNMIEYRARSVSIIDRELCCQLYHFNQAEKEYLRFLIAVMKNDQLRIESNLRSNSQIFKLFRNEFVFCIDDVYLFIDVSLDKYNDLFDKDEIKHFVLKLKINDNQIKQKLKILSLLLQKNQNNMKLLIEEIFPKIEELNSNEGLDDELAELLNNVFEEALVIFSII